MEGTILIIFYGVVSLFLVIGGVFAIWAGQNLFRQGVGLKKEGSALEAENSLFKIKVTASTVGGTLMLTAWLWGYFAMNNLPEFEDKNRGITISALNNKGVSFAELAAADIQPEELTTATGDLSSFEERLSAGRLAIVNEKERILNLEQTAASATALEDEISRLKNELLNIQNQTPDPIDVTYYGTEIEKLKQQIEQLENENFRLKSGPKDACGEILFRYDRDNICEPIKQKIKEKLTSIIEQNPDSIEVNGYTDPAGTEVYNLELGEKRANSVADLLKELGMSEDKVSVTSYGEEFSSELSEENHWQMRKVIIKVK